ncbi:MAG: hypothetical protein ACYDIC_05880 [Desulfobaccales bacterium]
MKVSSSAVATRFKPREGEVSVRIEFAIPSEGGNSSAGEKRDFKEKSVRLAWWRAGGRFDPFSSSELPDWGILDVIEACAAKDFFGPEELKTILKALTESRDRQLA